MNGRAMMTLALVVLSGWASFGGDAVVCAGDYPYHPQGVATDGTNIYWSFTTVLAKTDLSGKVLATFDEKDRWMGHIGDLCCKDGHLFAGVNRGFEKGIRPGDEVWEFDAELNVVKKYPTPEMIWRNNGLVSSAPERCIYNFLFEYTPDFRFKRCMPIRSGWTYVGVQTVFLYGDKLLFGCYGAGNGAYMYRGCEAREKSYSRNAAFRCNARRHGTCAGRHLRRTVYGRVHSGPGALRPVRS